MGGQAVTTWLRETAAATRRVRPATGYWWRGCAIAGLSAFFGVTLYYMGVPDLVIGALLGAAAVQYWRDCDDDDGG
jgi:hypothetical protein